MSEGCDTQNMCMRGFLEREKALGAERMAIFSWGVKDYFPIFLHRYHFVSFFGYRMQINGEYMHHIQYLASLLAITDYACSKLLKI